MSVTTITPQRLHELISKGEPAELIDVRTPVEFREVHVTIARNIPLTELDAKKIATTRRTDSRMARRFYVTLFASSRFNVALGLRRKP